MEGAGSVLRQQHVRIAKDAIRRIQQSQRKHSDASHRQISQSTNLLLTSIVVEFRFMPVDADRPGFPSSMHSFNPRSARERARFRVCRGLAVPSSTSNSTLNLALIFKMSFFPRAHCALPICISPTQLWAMFRYGALSAPRLELSPIPATRSAVQP